jgi:ABC transport system ATP-binding/permease protein
MSTLRSGPAGAGPVLAVRTRQSDHRFRAGTTYRLGRDPGSGIVMSDSPVSWRHAVLRHEQDTWILGDAGSANGTFAGTRRVDRITIGAECVARLGNPDDGPVPRCGPGARPVHAETEKSIPASAARALLNRPDNGGPGSPAAGPEAGPGWVEPGRDWSGGPRNGRQDDHGRGSGRGPAAGRPGPVPSVMDPARGPRPADYRLSVDRRPAAVLRPPGRLRRIGRTPDNDLVLSGLSVSRHHAELRKSGSGNYEIVDLGSHNGTFANGQRVTSAALAEKDIVSVGHGTFRLTDGELRAYIDVGDASLVAQDPAVQVGGGKILLDHVSFRSPSGARSASSARAARAGRPCSAR